MSRLFLICLIFIVSLFGFSLLLKKKRGAAPAPIATESVGETITISLTPTGPEVTSPKVEPKVEETLVVEAPPKVPEPVARLGMEPLSSEGLPTADRVEELFRADLNSIPFVKTISYKSKVPWLKGRPAWISDYASHHKTSRHFIARSLHGKGNYYKEDISIGDRFTVLDPDKNIEFHLLVDLSRCKLWLYAYDNSTHERVLLKDYLVGVGRPDALKASGLLTPKGKYRFGDRIVAYKPGIYGSYSGKKTEMIRVFGTRWIPFEKEIARTTAPARGFGIHGVPWVEDKVTGELKEDLSCLGGYNSDGCIRMASEDIEEVYAIIVSKPAFIDIVSDVHQAKLPGEEAR